MQEFSYDIRIPRDRVAALIGKLGKEKRELEKAMRVKIDVDSSDGEVVILGSDPLSLFATKEIIHAIGRGFNPDIARLLEKQDYGLEVINILDYAKTKNNMLRLKGRVIGEEGKSRHKLEALTDTHICVYGKTISILGRVEDIPLARKAIETLLAGRRHGNVYSWVEKRRKEIRLREVMSEKEESISV